MMSRRGMRLLALLGIATYASAAQAQLEGRILDADGSGVALPITLEVNDGQNLLYSEQVLADAAGVARWPDAPTDAGLFAQMYTVFDGAEYFSQMVVLQSENSELVVTVYPVARTGRPLHIDTFHLILQVDDPSRVGVLQFMTVSNAGRAAFGGGPALRSGVQSGLVIPLPTQATGIRPAPFPSTETALDETQAQVDPDRILDARPVPASGRQVGVTYELELMDDGVEVVLNLPYPTQAVNLLLGGAARELVTVTSDLLVQQFPEMIGEDQYDAWAAEALSPGTEVRFRVAPPGLTVSVQQWALIALGTGILLGSVAALFGAPGRNYQARGRATLVRKIAELDDRRDAGEISDSEYFARRASGLEQLSLLEASSTAASSDRA